MMVATVSVLENDLGSRSGRGDGMIREKEGQHYLHGWDSTVDVLAPQKRDSPIISFISAVFGSVLNAL
jgi:hypothetical protein